MSEVIDEPQVFDPVALASLTGHERDGELALVMVTRYLRLLPERVRRILIALQRRDADEAMDAVLSLKVSSATLGAHEIAALGAALERHLRQVDLPGADTVARRLGPAARRVEQALSAFVGR